jgi:hypothetical protein
MNSDCHQNCANHCLDSDRITHCQPNFLVINEFISSWTRVLPRLISGRALPSAVNRPLPRRPPGPRYARNFKSQIYNLESEIGNPEGDVPAHFRTRPSVAFDGYLLMNSLVIIRDNDALAR